MAVKISIIIPAYNRAGIISETLESVLKQTETDVECLVVDDCSTDNTAEVVAAFEHRDNRIQLVLNQQNRGACYCRNQGLNLAKGNLICFLDSDDLLDANYLTAQSETLSNSPEKGVAVCQTLRFHGCVENVVRFYGGLESPMTLARYLRRQISWSTSSAVWRVSVIKKLGGFSLELAMHQDWELNARYLVSGGEIAVTPKTLVYYRDQWGSDQISARKKNDKLRVFNLYQSRKSIFEHAMKKRSLNLEIRSAMAPHFINLPAQLFKHGYYWQTLDGLMKSIYLTRHLYPFKKFVTTIVQ